MMSDHESHKITAEALIVSLFSTNNMVGWVSWVVERLKTNNEHGQLSVLVSKFETVMHENYR
jgi:hypothetical protein